MRLIIASLFCFAAVSLAACATTPPTAETTLTPEPTTDLAVATPAQTVEIRVMPNMIRPGMRAMVVGSGFEGGESVAFYLIRPDGTKTSEGLAKADKNGGAAYEIDVTNDWLPGQYIAHVRSRKNPTRTAEQKFELGPR